MPDRDGSICVAADQQTPLRWKSRSPPLILSMAARWATAGLLAVERRRWDDVRDLRQCRISSSKAELDGPLAVAHGADRRPPWSRRALCLDRSWRRDQYDSQVAQEPVRPARNGGDRAPWSL